MRVKTLIPHEIPDIPDAVFFFSEGQKRRISVALALLTRSDVIVMDEPTRGIDPIVSEASYTVNFTNSVYGSVPYSKLERVGTAII